MSSERHHSERRSSEHPALGRSSRGRALARRLAPLLVLALLVPLGGCGRKENPKPPPRKNPARTNDLKVTQQGMELVLTMSYPSATAGGLALAGIDRVEYRRYSRPAPELMPREPGETLDTGEETEAGAEESLAGVGTQAAETPEESQVTEAPQATSTVEVEDVEARESEGSETRETPAETGTGVESEEPEAGETEAVAPNPYLQIAVDPELFAKNAEEILVLEGEALQQAVIGGSIVTRIPLDEIPTDPPTAYTFSVRTYAGRLRSPESRLASFAPLPPPEPPRQVEIEAEAGGVRLRWEAPAGETEIEGYRIFRRGPQATLYGDPVATLQADATEYFDRSATYGSRYVYAMTALGMRNPVVESVLAGEADVRYEDTFPPQQPRGVVALSQAGSTRLVWEASPARDIAGYLVFVSQDDGEKIQLTPEPVVRPEYVHRGTQSGATYTYTVVAVDSSGNQSRPSDAVSTRVP